MNEPGKQSPQERRDASAGDQNGLSLATRVALWSVALVVLGVTFAAYDQVALALQWVVMKLC